MYRPISDFDWIEFAGLILQPGSAEGLAELWLMRFQVLPVSASDIGGLKETVMELSLTRCLTFSPDYKIINY